MSTAYTMYEEMHPLRMLNNGQRKLLLMLAEQPVAGLDSPPPTARTAARLVKFGLASRVGVEHRITLAGWVWLARAILHDVPAEVTNPEGLEFVRWQRLAERLDMADVVYHGTRGADPSDGRVITVEDPDTGDVEGTLRHVVRHSPDGPNWGYPGSGPSDCARSLLIAALGDPIAVCGTCAGTRRIVAEDPVIEESPLVPFDPDTHDPDAAWPCLECDGGYVTLPYHAFKNEIIAQFEAEWYTDRSSVLAWLDQALAPELVDQE